MLLDANLLLPVVVGEFDPASIGRKRLDTYGVSDLHLLLGIAADFPRRLTTPHLLTEVGNLADQCVPRDRHHAFRGFLASSLGS